MVWPWARISSTSVVEVEDPVERLLRRGDVVAPRAEDDDRRADVAQVDGGAVGGADLARGEVVADEELVDDPLHLLGVELHEAAPVLLEAEVALGLGVDLGPDVVLLGPEGVRRVLVLEVLHQPGAVEDAAAEVAGQRGQPRAAEQAARVAHRVLAAHAGPVGERRARDDDRAEELRAERVHHHHRPAGLAVADDAGLSLGVRMAGDDRLQEHRLRAGDVLDGLAGHGIGQEADEVAGVAGLHRHADLAVGLEAADAGTVAGAGVDHDEGPLQRVDVDAFGRDDSGERVVHRAFQTAAVQHELGLVVEHVRGGLRRVLLGLGGAPAQDIEEQDRALPGVDRVFHGCGGRRQLHGRVLGHSAFLWLKAGGRRVGHPALVRGRQGSPRVRRLSTTPPAVRPSGFDIDYIVNLT